MESDVLPKAFGSNDSEERDPLQEGFFAAGISREQLQIYGEFFNDFYQKIRDRDRPRQITRNALTMLQGGIFALGTKKLNNPEWQEHCSSSFREIFHEWSGFGQFENDFKQFYPLGWPSRNLSAFRELKNRYGYFCGIDHHEASGVLGSLIALTGDNTLKIGDCYKSGIFVEQVKGFFGNISLVIETSKKT